VFSSSPKLSLSLSPSETEHHARVYYRGISEREQVRKKEKKRKETEKTLTAKDDTKSSFLVLFLFLFRSFNEEEHHLEKTEKRSIKKGSEQ
jgi:hypothetical protein